ncbi:MAG: fimbrillin family protein [Candidatus Cryptobacteroides sp.]|nr:fimbrillin family protein [Bacteroidales bacterium]MDY6159111.1 fimbrillin family protein [Candidatus Cryptobacteroides sp.]
MKHRLYYKSLHLMSSLLISSLLLAISCTKQDTTGYSLSFDAKAVDAAFAGKAGAGEGVIQTTDSNLKNLPFGVFGGYSDDAGDENFTNVFLSSAAQKVSWNTEKWTYDPLQYWKLNKFYRFRAYHPYSGSAFSINAMSDVDDIFIEYAINAGKEDLLVGFQTVESTASNIKNKVKFAFKHALCALEFKIAFKNDPFIEDSYTDNLTSFHLSGLIPTGTLQYTHEDGNYLSDVIKWDATYFDDGKYYEWTGSKQFPKYNGNNAIRVFDGNDGLVFCIPQTCSPSETKQTTVNFKTEKAGAAVHSAPLPKMQWEPGKVYTYTLLINKSDLEISVTIKDWDKIQANEDLFL